MKINKILFTFGILAILITIIFSAGCSGSNSQSTYSPKIIPRAELHVTIPQSDSKWSLGLGCYYQPTGTAYNSGNAQADNVIVTVSLIDSNSGTIRDSKSVAIGSLEPGQSQSFSITLDGECNHNYSMKSSIR